MDLWVDAERVVERELDLLEVVDQVVVWGCASKGGLRGAHWYWSVCGCGCIYGLVKCVTVSNATAEVETFTLKALGRSPTVLV